MQVQQEMMRAAMEGKKKDHPVKQMKVMKAEMNPKYQQLTCIMMHWYQMGTLIQCMCIRLWGTRSKVRMK